MKKTSLWSTLVASSTLLVIAACVADPAPEPGTGTDDGGSGDGTTLGDGSATDASDDAHGGDAACTQCGASCVDLQSSAANCGACGKACKTGTSCGGGHCANEVLAAIPGSDTSCALLASGEVWCWGDDEAGELGAASATEKCDPEPLITTADSGQVPCRIAPAKIAGLPASKALCGGSKYFCALAADDTAWCWGLDDSHQLGHVAADPDAGTTKPLSSRTPTQVAAISSLAQITCGDDFACALTKSGSVYCWGSNAYGNLGSQPDSGTGPSSATPVLIGGLPTASEISASNHVCAVTSDHHVWCWGSNALDAVGHDTTVYCGFSVPCQPVPAVVATDDQAHAFDGIDHVQTGNAGTCAHKSDGTVWCWGSNLTGALGNGTNEAYPGSNHPAPTAISGVGNSAAFLQYRGGAVLVGTSTGVSDWGSNIYGELGAGTFSVVGQSSCQPFLVMGGCLDTPGAMSSLAGMKAIHAGLTTVLGVKADNTVWAWGNNSTGQLGHAQFGDAGDVACAQDAFFQEAYCNPRPLQVLGLP